MKRIKEFEERIQAIEKRQKRLLEVFEEIKKSEDKSEEKAK